MSLRNLLVIAAIPCALVAQAPAGPPDLLPASATAQLARSFEVATTHTSHVWRDTSALNSDGSVNAYIEISRGDRRKWEFDMRLNARAIDRVMPEDLGGYPVNYGFVPQTVSYDGDPFDALVLGPPARAGRLMAGAIVGLMFMEDEKGLDSKVVLSRTGGDARPIHELTTEVQREIGDYFRRYKLHEPGAFSRVPGWGSAAQGLAHVSRTGAFFRECRRRAGVPCRLGQ